MSALLAVLPILTPPPVGPMLAAAVPASAHEATITTGGQIIIALIGLLSAYLVVRVEGTRKAATVAAAAAGNVPTDVAASLGRIEERQLITARELEGLRENDRRLWDRIVALSREGQGPAPHPLRRASDAWDDHPQTPPGD